MDQRMRITTTITGLAAALLALGALSGCGSAKAPSALASPTVAPSIDDSSVTVVPPEPSLATSAAPSSGTGTAGAGAGGGAGAGAAKAPFTSKSTPVAPPGVITGAAGTAATTVPGIADGAVALPPSATVVDNGRCRTSVLRLQPVDLQGSPGGTYANFRIQNTSATTCAVRGYVGARLIDDAGKDLATSVRHEAGPDVWVRIAPRGIAQFHLRFANPLSGSAPCNPPNAARVRISLASAPGSLTAATPEGGIQACNGEVSTAPVGST